MILLAVWLIVVGYALAYIGYHQLNHKPVSFASALWGGS